MVNSYRIKEYIFPQTAASNVGSSNDLYTSHSINGEILRIDTVSNYTGSLALWESGLNVPWVNSTVTSGTAKKESFNLINTTGSFVTNGFLRLNVSGLASGTANVFGPVSILYR